MKIFLLVLFSLLLGAAPSYAEGPPPEYPYDPVFMHKVCRILDGTPFQGGSPYFGGFFEGCLWERVGQNGMKLDHEMVYVQITRHLSVPETEKMVTLIKEQIYHPSEGVSVVPLKVCQGGEEIKGYSAYPNRMGYFVCNGGIVQFVLQRSGFDVADQLFSALSHMDLH